MSTSKIPQNRVSRLAAPSRLPGRILKPTFTNQSSSNSASFVNSAKQIEKRKDLIRNTEQALTESTHNSKNQAKADTPATKITVDCNGNKDIFVHDKISRHSEHYSARDLSDKHTTEMSNNHVSLSTKKRNETLSTTVKACEGSKFNTQSASKVDDAPTFRSLKPGYFLQKVSALKSSHQKLKSDSEKPAVSIQKYGQSVLLPSKLTLPSQSIGNHVPEKGKFGYKSEENVQVDNAPDTKPSVVTSTMRHRLPPASSRILSQTSSTVMEKFESATPSHARTYLSRAEKRKKYLEVRSSSKISSNSVEPNETKTDYSSSFGFQKSDSSNRNGLTSTNDNSSQDSQSNRRTYLRKPPLRNAKIARPVPRPKKNASPIIPKPYGSENRQLPSVPTAKSKNDVTSKSNNHVDENIMKNFLSETQVQSKISLQSMSNLGATGSLKNEERVLLARLSDDYTVNSVASEESGYSSVASTVYNDTSYTNSNGIKAPSSPNARFDATKAWSGVRPYNECENYQSTNQSNYQSKLPNGQSSNSLNDVLSAVFDDDEDEGDYIEANKEQQRYVTYIASKDIITYGEYRLQTEGNYSPEERYGSTEAKQIRTSSGSDSDIGPTCDVRSSPDCGNASDSSAETVIPNTISPLPSDVFQPESSATLDSTKDHNSETNTLSESLNIEIKPELVIHVNGAKIRENDLKCQDENSEKRNDFAFSTSSVSALQIFQAKTPETTNCLPDTPSTSSTSKAKKRKTDTLIMSPLIIVQDDEKENKNNNEKSTKSERKKLFEDENEEEDANVSEADEEENLSQFIDLPSLHESALMEDYNSILEDEDETYGNVSDDDVKVDESSKSTVNSTVETTVINRLLSQGLNGIVRSDDDVSVAHTNQDESAPLTNGYHTLEHEESKIVSLTKKQNTRSNNISDSSQKPIYTEEEFRMYKAELKAMKMSLAELYKILEVEDVQKRRLNEENKRLHSKNQELTQMMKNLTDQLNSVKLSGPSRETENKIIQVEIEHSDVSTDTNDDQVTDSNQKTSKLSSESSTSPRWFHNEVSEEVESNIKVASEEIKFLKDLRGDFDKRIDDAEQRLNSALELLHR